jgi:hypothetical protein
MGGLFETVVGIVVVILGARIFLNPNLVVLGHQMELSAYHKPLGIALGIAGFLWIWMGLKKKKTDR